MRRLYGFIFIWLTSSTVSLAAPPAEATELTAHPRFSHGCLVFATGYGASQENPGKLSPVFGRKLGECPENVKPFVVSVTHENFQNNHKGAANEDPRITSHMSDFNYDADFGRWFNVAIASDAKPPTLKMSLDTVKFNKVNVTGWPLRYGHLFIGCADPSTHTKDMSKSIWVEFEFRVLNWEAKPELAKGFNGSRILLGLVGDWQEAQPRTNRKHHLEIDFVQSDGYTESYNEGVKPLCKDCVYDRCNYDPNGHFSEEREIRYQPQRKVVPIDPERWVHVKIPVSALFHTIHWVSPPARWSDATLKTVYFGIESVGATQNVVEYRNYHVYTEPAELDPKHPENWLIKHKR